ncbi:Hypothetical predicted protein [Pelobates cultripes]|uniref:Uncharacterized protein n=1 Tax=Pelobates cultripes TaxID=61616 RepID=A0AAD1WH98_PELCU|nr:Hypothetical predicted protein [Pelobates cultripes]
MTDEAGEHAETTWKANFNAEFDKICAVLWCQIEVRAEQTQPPITPTSQLQTAAISETNSIEPTSPDTCMDDAVVSASCLSPELGSYLEAPLLRQPYTGETATNRRNPGPTTLGKGSMARRRECPLRPQTEDTWCIDTAGPGTDGNDHHPGQPKKTCNGRTV